MIEKHTRLTLQLADGKLNHLLIAGNHMPHLSCTAGHDTNIGDTVMYYANFQNYTWPKIEGVVIAKEVVGWDWSKPIGERLTSAPL